MSDSIFDEHSLRSDRYISILFCFHLMSFHAHMFTAASALILSVFFFLQMTALSFEHLLDSLQSPESLPQDMMTSYEVLHFEGIHFVPLQHTLNMQWVSLTYLKSLVNDNSFQPEGIKPSMHSSTTAILILFLSDEEHKSIEHMCIGLVLHSEECCLYM